ncbi:flagellar hook-associated protein FlgK [Sulfurospirillum deleyianum]|uniref:Flagellar hook-associated protein 1 n=1 Tax=Sulfurospirillum deleyianum (strain ATCC 51133 / DSM 6946 / 5175) TaxID=525898 RepID=D1B242_SULD5|nr:flagellar hook-associated protein FlgK [Sulfurospirillum deleyianum]ACZ12162.1 flagellar hook-associated protein FlgK [Sulfurospirillum deleyianum DSM 6946]
MGIFSTLNTGTSALNAAQVAVATTSQNIANVDNPYYTRQRVTLSASDALNTKGVSIGTGVSITSIVRIHDEFVFSKLRTSSTSLAYDSYSKQVLEEVAQKFPDLDDSGISQNVADYFAAWNDLSTNASEGSQKIALVQLASTLTSNIQSSKESLRSLQDTLNEQLKTSVDEINSIGQQMADLNKQINLIESEEGNYANDLRDQRDELELTLSNLVGVTVSKGKVNSDTTVDANMTDSGTDYYINIAGSSFVDGSTFHPIVIDNTSNTSNFYSVYSESQDGTRYDLTELLSGGKVGATLDLRGRIVDASQNDGYPLDGTIQGYIDNLDTFAQTLITETNNIYAQSAQEGMQSPVLDLKANTALQNAYNNIQNGTFDLIVYNSEGEEVARKSVSINSATTMGDDTFSESILTQINTNSDDNGDNNGLNDLDDYFTATFLDDGTFSLTPKGYNTGYTIAFEDKGTNFPGVIGVSQFLTGTNASDISVATQYKKDPSLMQGYSAPVDGNNKVANAMVQMQYSTLGFYSKTGSSVQDTIEGFYSSLTTKIGSDASTANSNYDTNDALYSSVYTQYQSVSGVNKDEELANLIQYQSSYSAAAKIITTIDQMLETLLGIKS